jgi:hypothetical protein
MAAGNARLVVLVILEPLLERLAPVVALQAVRARAHADVGEERLELAHGGHGVEGVREAVE